MSAVLGMDPGTKGAASVLRGDGTIAFVRAFQPTMTRGEFWDLVATAAGELRYAGGQHAFLEKVQYIGGRGPKCDSCGHVGGGDGGQGSFTFGRADGWCEMALTGQRLMIHDVFPMAWQSRLECLTGGDKNVSKRRAIDLFGHETKITLAIADALLIAEYGRRCLA